MELNFNRLNPLYLFLGVLAMIVVTLGFSASASAHGYVDGPKSRALLCKEGVNYDCGGVVYEPQSVEGRGDYPQVGVPDGQIASGGGVFPKLDEQGEYRWSKVAMTSGANQFSWTLTAVHATADWKYYVTNEGWDPNSELTRADFELFCTYDEGGKRPDSRVTHDCVVPERDGYHVILAYWEIADTPMAFYQVIDANFDGGFVEPDPTDPPDPDLPSGAYDPTKVYLGGDQVTHNGNTYQAAWWTQGQEPGTNSVWVLVTTGGGDPGNGGDPIGDAYSSSKVYLAGDIVSYNGQSYKAAWWTLGEAPGTSSVWILQ